MRDVIDEFEHSGFTVKIFQDPDAEAPDNNEDDLFIVTARNRHFQPKTPRGLTVDDVAERDFRKDYHVLPLFAYIHSGIALSLGREYPFDCPWDAGQIGVVCVGKRAGFSDIHKAADGLVETWNQYLSGDAYGYAVEENGEHLDSCWGFYGLDFARSEAKVAADYEATSRAKTDKMQAECFAL
jgi:hypothetical protein